MTDLKPLVGEMVIAGLDDWVMAAEVAWVAESIGGVRGPRAIRRLARRMIRAALAADLMEVGDVGDGGFIGWDLSIDQAVRRVDELWRALDHPVGPGDVCWLRNTEAGCRLARALSVDK